MDAIRAAKAAGFDAVNSLNEGNLKIKFDCYRAARNDEDVSICLNDLLLLIGHPQFAVVPDRGPPDWGIRIIANCSKKWIKSEGGVQLGQKIIQVVTLKIG